MIPLDLESLSRVLRLFRNLPLRLRRFSSTFLSQNSGLRAAVLIPVAVSMLLSFSFLGSRGSLDGHEVLVAQTAREMVRSGDWIRPTFAGEPRFQKPPLAYWMVSCSYLITGVQNEWSARLPSALVTVLGVGLLSWYAAHRVGPSFGMLAGLIQATSIWTIGFGKSALVDGTLTVLVLTAMLLASFDRLPTAVRWSYVVAGFWACCGLIVLAKGPVGLAIVWPSVLLYRLLRQRRATVRPLLFHRSAIAGIGLFLVLTLGWPLAVVRSHPEALSLWLDQSVGRYLQHWKDDPPPWYYYLYYTPFLTLPWAPLWMMRLFRKSSKPRNLQERDLLLLSWVWFSVGVTLLSLSAGKRPHYILPALPALSLIAAFGFRDWTRWWRPIVTKHGSLMRSLGVVAILCTVATAASQFGAEMHRFQLPAAIAGGLLIVAYLAALDWTRTPRHSHAAALFWVCVVGVALASEAWVAPEFDGRPGRRALVARNREAFDQAEVVLQIGSNDHSTIFDVDRPMKWLRHGDDAALGVAAFGSTLVLAPASDLERLQDSLSFEVVDVVGPEASLGEQDPDRRWALLRPTSAHWTNRTNQDGGRR